VPPWPTLVLLVLAFTLVVPGKENSNSHGARPVHLIITTIKWTRTGRLAIQNSLSLGAGAGSVPEDMKWLVLTDWVEALPRS